MLLAVDLPSALLGLIGLLAARSAIRRVMRGAIGKDLIEVLGATGRTQILTAVALSVGLVLA